MATYYTYTLENGCHVHAGPESTIMMADGTTKSSAQVEVGDRIAPVYGSPVIVASIATVEM